ncbi:hypothetical protein KIPB_012768, partial [Kipferlia bialata]|eukprot:g12768.t1
MKWTWRGTRLNGFVSRLVVGPTVITKLVSMSGSGLPALLLCLSVLAVCACSTGFSGDVLFLNDIHYDPLYVPNSQHQPDFCRTTRPWLSADDGSFGRYGCDAPLNLVEAHLSAASAAAPEASLIILNGDLPAHSLSDYPTQMEAMDMVVTLIRKHWPDTEVLVSIGNNDCFPDYYMPVGPNSRLEDLATSWDSLLDE